VEGLIAVADVAAEDMAAEGVSAQGPPVEMGAVCLLVELGDVKCSPAAVHTAPLQVVPIHLDVRLLASQGVDLFVLVPALLFRPPFVVVEILTLCLICYHSLLDACIARHTEGRYSLALVAYLVHLVRDCSQIEFEVRVIGNLVPLLRPGEGHHCSNHVVPARLGIAEGCSLSVETGSTTSLLACV
jgi:hypothetical protein